MFAKVSYCYICSSISVIYVPVFVNIKISKIIYESLACILPNIMGFGGDQVFDYKSFFGQCKNQNSLCAKWRFQQTNCKEFDWRDKYVSWYENETKVFGDKTDEIFNC